VPADLAPLDFLAPQPRPTLPPALRLPMMHPENSKHPRETPPIDGVHRKVRTNLNAWWCLLLAGAYCLVMLQPLPLKLRLLSAQGVPAAELVVFAYRHSYLRCLPGEVPAAVGLTLLLVRKRKPPCEAD
jgi:hypothetical protein